MRSIKIKFIVKVKTDYLYTENNQDDKITQVQ